MPSVVVKLRSFYFKTVLKHKLLNSQDSPSKNKDGYVASPSSSNRAPANASFTDGVATKDVNIDQSVTLRIFLPESALCREDQMSNSTCGHGTGGKDTRRISMPNLERKEIRRNSDAGYIKKKKMEEDRATDRRTSWGGDLSRRNGMERIENPDDRRTDGAGQSHKQEGIHVTSNSTDTKWASDRRIDEAQQWIIHEGNQGMTVNTDVKPTSDLHLKALLRVDQYGSKSNSVTSYHGYIPDFTAHNHKKLPIIVYFHGGGFVTGTKDSVANDVFCRHMAKLCDAIVVSVGYRLAPEHKYPAAFDDGFDALSWLAKQANLAECKKTGVGHNNHHNNSLSLHSSNHKQLIDTFGGSTIVEPWLAAHGDPSR
jgi:hypothetical protein